jgi:hypothetical protein
MARQTGIETLRRPIVIGDGGRLLAGHEGLYISPPLTAGDVVRATDHVRDIARRERENSYCRRHKAEVCDCFMTDIVEDGNGIAELKYPNDDDLPKGFVVLCMHRLGLSGLARAMISNTPDDSYPIAYVATIRTDSICGTLNDEVTWWRPSQGNLRLELKGSTEYKDIRDLDWKYRQPENMHGLRWHRVTSIGHLDIYKFVLVDRNVVPHRIELPLAGFDENNEPELLENGAFVARMTGDGVSTSPSVAAWFTTQGDEEYLIPTSVVERAITRVSCKPRDNASFQTLIPFVRRIMDEHQRDPEQAIPSHQVASVIPLVVEMALTAGLKTEQAMFERLAASKEKFDKHEKYRAGWRDGLTWWDWLTKVIVPLTDYFEVPIVSDRVIKLVLVACLLFCAFFPPLVWLVLGAFGMRYGRYVGLRRGPIALAATVLFAVHCVHPFAGLVSFVPGVHAAQLPIPDGLGDLGWTEQYWDPGGSGSSDTHPDDLLLCPDTTLDDTLVASVLLRGSIFLTLWSGLWLLALWTPLLCACLRCCGEPCNGYKRLLCPTLAAGVLNTLQLLVWVYVMTLVLEPPQAEAFNPKELPMGYGTVGIVLGCLPCMILLLRVAYRLYDAHFSPREIWSTTTTLEPVPTTAKIIQRPEVREVDNHRRSFVQVGPLLCDVPLACLASNVVNERVGITRRAAPVGLPIPDPGTLGDFMFFWEQNYPVLFTAGEVVPYTPETWLKRYSERQRNVFLRALERHRDDPARDDIIAGAKFFVKNELSHWKDDGYGGHMIKPRIIVSCDPVYTVRLGCWFAGYAKQFGHRWSPRIFRGASDRWGFGDWLESYCRGGHTYEADYSTFDATVNVNVRLLLGRIYNRYHGLSGRNYLWFKKRARVKSGRTQSGLIVKYEGTTGSGEPDTYESNSLINVFVQFYCYTRSIIDLGLVGDRDQWARQLSAPQIRRIWSDFAMAVSSDDSVVNTRYPLDLSYATKLGFVIKSVKHPCLLDTRLNTVEYCSSVVMPRRGEDGQIVAYLTPKPGRILARTPFVRTRVGLDDSDVRGVVCGLWYTCSHTPIVREWLLRVYELVGPGEMRIIRVWGALGQTSTPTGRVQMEYPEHVYEWLEHRYGLNRAAVKDYQDYVARAPRYCKEVHPVAQRVTDVDLGQDQPDAAGW